MVRVRVRGIASTALTKILVDRGYRIVQASDVIRSRFNLPADNSPADVTVKDGDEPDTVLVIGFYKQASMVYEDLVSTLEYVFKWKPRVGLYAMYRGLIKDRVDDTCIVDLGSTDGLLNGCRDNVGEYVTVSVIKTPLKPGDRALLSYDLKLVGELVAVTYGSKKLTISRHIKDPDKRSFLSAIGLSKILGSGFGLHFRSSSSYASKEEVEFEIDSLIAKMKEIVGRVRNVGSKVEEIYEGEFIGLIGLTSLAKRRLDEVRGEVFPTIIGHHSYKYMSRELSNMVDDVELELNQKGGVVSEVSRVVRRKVVENAVNNGLVRFIHVKPDGSIRLLKPGVVLKAEEIGDGVAFYVKREITSNGVYDGLGVEKRRGDVDYVFFTTDGWFLSHNYYRENSWLGSYINVNTPPEVGVGVVKYHDLLIDIVVENDGRVEVRDQEEFEEHCSEGLISHKLCSETIKVVENVLNNTDRYVYKHV